MALIQNPTVDLTSPEFKSIISQLDSWRAGAFEELNYDLNQALIKCGCAGEIAIAENSGRSTIICPR